MTKPRGEVDQGGDLERRVNGYLHRTDGPAYTGKDGTRAWYINGHLHRTDGPAIEWSDGRREWWVNGKRHRPDGPATEYPSGRCEWFVNGTYVTHRVLPYLAEGMSDADAVTAVLIDLERKGEL